VRWDDTVDKEKTLDYVFAHQRITKVNDAMLAQYGATAEQFVGLTPNDFFAHDIAYGKKVWREFFDAGRLHVETDERKFDGTPIRIEGDYICFYDDAGRITGHFGIQRDVTERKRAEQALQQYNQRLKILQEIDRAILSRRAGSPQEIAQAAMRHIHELVPCLRASVAVFDFTANKAVLIAIHAKAETKLDVGAEFPLEAFGDIGQLWLGKVRAVENTETLADKPALARVHAEGVRSFINVPIQAQGELVGALNLGADRPGRFSDEDIEIMQEVANSLAIAIRQARLFEQIAQHASELERHVAERTAELFEANASLKSEIAERKRAERALHHRLAIEQMISDISTRFINLSWQQLDDGVNYALERMGKLAGVDRSYLFLFFDGGTKARNTHEWCAPEVMPQMQNLQDLVVADFPWIFPKIFHGETVYVPRVAELPVEAQAEKAIMQEQEIQSLLIVPLTFGGTVAGFLGFDSVKSEKVWQEEDVRLLMVVGEIIAKYFQGARAEQVIRENIYLQEELKSEMRFGEMIGASEAMQKVFRNIEMVAATDSTVLLLGETGTGKELIARAIHNLSKRKDRVMVKVNCGALPAGLVESELFGHEKGAFTGATAQKKGRFELANYGTIFLDEVGELSHDIQVKLLRVLQEHEFERVGGAATLKVDVRVIAATNRNLEEGVKNGSFRPDLFYRLNIFPIQIPPLRQRAEDIPLLANYLIGQFARRLGKRINGINQQALEKLRRYDWPGNVRELANILERAVILCQGRVLQEEHIGELSASPRQAESFLTLEEAERRHILHALEKTGGVLAGPKGAAQLLGINRSTLWSRMRKLGINAPTP
jgi:PAS domain S-box-containing protein